MTVNVEAWMLQASATIETAVGESVHEVAAEAAKLIRDYTYPGRRLTRNSVRAVITGQNSAVVGLYFGKRYSGNTNTFTHRHFRETIEDIRPELAKRFASKLSNKLNS